MKKHELYELINTLTPAEKKVFKEKFSATKSENFIRLFDAISKKEVTNDKEVKIKFAGDKFIAHLHKTKAYLYNAVLESLHSQILGKYDRLQILHHLAIVETLLSRKLNSQAETVLINIIKKIEQSEEIELEYFAINQIIAFNILAYTQQKTHHLILKIKAKMEQLLAYQQLFYEVFNAYSLRGQTSNVSLAHYKEHVLIKKPPKFLSKNSERFFALTQSILNTVEKDYKKALQINLEIASLIEPIAHVNPRNENAYVSALFNVIVAMQNRQENEKRILLKLEKFQPHSLYAKSHQFSCLIRLKLNTYLLNKKSAKGKILINWVEQELLHYHEFMDDADLIKTHFYIASLYLKEQEYNKALDYLLLIYNTDIAKKKRPIFYRVALLYKMIAYYELNNVEVLSALLRKHRYFQKKQNTFYVIESLTHQYLSNAINLNNKQQKTQEKKIFEMKLKEATKSSPGNGLEYLQKIDWVG